MKNSLEQTADLNNRDAEQTISNIGILDLFMKKKDLFSNQADKIYSLVLVLFFFTSVQVIFSNLGAANFLGDELNAIHFFKDNLVDYLKSFHYGHSIKIQFWALHKFFGHSFLHYRMPAAIAALCTLLLIFFPQKNYRPSLLSLAFVLPVLSLNQSFLYFARWGMPIYAEGIFLSALLILNNLLTLKEARSPHLQVWQFPIMFALIWIYPATLLLLGSLSLYYTVCLLIDLVKNKKLNLLKTATRLFNASLPVIVGLISYFLLRTCTNSEHWARARGHHINFSQWLSSNPGKSALDFVLEAPVSLISDLKMFLKSVAHFTPLLNSAFILCLLAIIVAPLLAWSMFKNSNTKEFARDFLRNYSFLLCIFTVSVSVSIFAALFDAFPAGKIRYLPFLLPNFAMLAILSISFLEKLLLAKQKVFFLASLLICFSACVIYFKTAKEVSRNYSSNAIREGEILEIINQPSTKHILSWKLGLFYPATLTPGHASLEHNIRGEISPATIRAANEIRKTQKGKLVLLSRTFEVGTNRSELEKKLKALLTELNLQVEKYRSSGSIVLVVLGVRTK